ncbi:MAG TPA: sensor histidine kinase [Streptosporangiaceae bacterium]
MHTLATRLTSLPQALVARVSKWPPRQQELLQDGALGVALAVVNVLSVLPYRSLQHPLWLAILLVTLQGVLLTGRRWHPVLIALAIGAVRVTYDQSGLLFAPFPLGVAIAYYTVMDRTGAIWRWIVTGFVVAGISVALAAPGHNEPYDAITQAFIFLTAGVGGVLTRAKRGTLAAAESRAAWAEAELDRQSSRAAAQERAKIARELHDVVAHHVSLMAVQAEATASLLPGQPEKAQRSADIISDTARAALTELRRLLGVLRSPSEQLETAPSASLSELGGVLDQVRGAGLEVDFDVRGTPARLAPGVDLTAFRIVQEALTNTIRHAHTARATVTLTHEPGYITVSVADSGPRRGPDLAGAGARETALSGSGLGLAGIAERVASCGGQLSVGPTAAGGFSVSARLPVR